MAALFFSVMRFDPENPRAVTCDRFVLSRGHAAPLLYAAWAAVGVIPREALVTLRQLDSDLEGHPTPRLPFVDVASGSLGQGLGVGIGLALGARLADSDARAFVLLGDGETAEGSVTGVHVHRLAVREIPRGGRPQKLLERYGVGREAIVEAARRIVAGAAPDRAVAALTRAGRFRR